MTTDTTTDAAAPSVPATLTRRRLLTLAGIGTAVAGTALIPATGVAAADAATTTTTSTTFACSTDSAEQEVGPFYVADGLVRSDIVAGEDGVALSLTITLTDSSTCGPLVGAAVDVWQASALGVYSDESQENTVGETYLRGVQVTDTAGQVTFTTVFPGWYAGRTMHIHLRIYTGGTVTGTAYSYTGANLVHTGQMFFDPTTSTTIAATAPYTSNPNSPRTVNSADRVYTEQNGATALITTSGSVSQGYTGAIALVVTGDGTTTTGSGTGTGTTTTSPHATSLTIAASSTHVQAGGKVTLSGQLRDTTKSTGVPDQDITLTATLPNGKTHTKIIETTDNGAWSYTFTPTATATYRVAYIGSTTYAAARSSSVAVTVSARCVISHVSPTAPAAKRITMSGIVAPTAKGTVVTVHAVTATGAHKTLVKTTTNAEGYWTAHWHMKRGKHKVLATVPATTTHRAATSRTVVVRRS